eukprot:522474-Hanusia_phi.AAC.2
MLHKNLGADRRSRRETWVCRWLLPFPAMKSQRRARGKKEERENEEEEEEEREEQEEEREEQEEDVHHKRLVE